MEPMSGVEPLPYLVMNYAVLNTTLATKRKYFNNLIHDFPHG